MYRNLPSAANGNTLPLVSVIMPVYNGEKYLAEAIESVLSQTFTNFELLIVDDGSTDGSAEIIRAFEAQDRRVRFIQLAHNIGMADAWNQGIAATTAEYITGMDCDDVSLPQRLEKQVDFMRDNPHIGGVGTWACRMNQDLTQIIFDLQTPPQHALIALHMFFNRSVVGATVMYRQKYIRAVGGYTPGINGYHDRDLQLRLLWDTDIRFANLPDILYLYRKHEHAWSVIEERNSPEEGLARKRLAFARLCGKTPEATMNRLHILSMRGKLGWAQRRAAKRDLKRLIESMIAHNWVEPEDKPLLIAEINRSLEQASPRRWQQFCHWRRHRLGF